LRSFRPATARTPPLPGRLDHRQRGTPHPQQAHLREIVEVVFVQDRDLRPCFVERGAPFGFGLREHANAAHVRITISAHSGGIEARVEDDGAGFHVARTLLDSAQRGRLGLVGGSERIRLLGGKFDVSSKPGGPTTVAMSLPRWRPMGVEQSGDVAGHVALAAE
jgi:hypothetical protein